MNINEAYGSYCTAKRAFDWAKEALELQVEIEYQKRNSVEALMELAEMLPAGYNREPILRKIRLLS